VLVDFLRANTEIFAWSPSDMPGITRDVVEHSLYIRAGARPVKQPLRHFDEEKRRAIGEELHKLMAAGFIKEVFHPEWLANPIVIPQFLEKKLNFHISFLSCSMALGFGVSGGIPQGNSRFFGIFFRWGRELKWESEFGPLISIRWMRAPPLLPNPSRPPLPLPNCCSRPLPLPLLPICSRPLPSPPLPSLL
jgi:hypothetical protein